MKERLKNANFPKCVNCLQNKCEAGEVNHDSRGQDQRQNCLFNCGCIKFTESNLSREELEYILKEIK